MCCWVGGWGGAAKQVGSHRREVQLCRAPAADIACFLQFAPTLLPPSTLLPHRPPCTQAAARAPCLALSNPTRHTAPPPCRGLHSLTTLGSQLYLFGGAPQRGPMLGDLWVLDTAQQPLQWQQLAPAGPAPPPRCSHVAAAVGKDLLILGGSYYK